MQHPVIHEETWYHGERMHYYILFDFKQVGNLTEGAIVAGTSYGEVSFEDMVLVASLIMPGIISVSLDAYSVEVETDPSILDRELFLDMAAASFRQYLADKRLTDIARPHSLLY